MLNLLVTWTFANNDKVVQAAPQTHERTQGLPKPIAGLSVIA